MSGKLWEFFLRDDVESFRSVLASASYKNSGGTPNSKAGGSGSVIASSPGIFHRSKKLGEASPGTPVPDRSTTSRPGRTISREELNARDHYGRTLLHHVASSPKPTAIDFAILLLETPFIDIYAQDWESGWTALHRALYAGNAAIAQALMARDIRDATDFSKAGSPGHPGGGLIKVKDREGYSPFDVYGATISTREIKRMVLPATEHDPLLADVENRDDESSASSFGEDMDEDGHAPRGVLRPRVNLLADEVYTFGSNKNLNLGVGDQDDRQFPERMTLKRPEHLLRRFFRESQEQRGDDHHSPDPDDTEDLPALIRNRPIKYQDIVMSKLHTAILTTDPEANLFTCGFGPGGRLGTGDESTRFSFVCIEGGGLANRKVVSVALGQDHTLAISEQGEIFSWGSNKYGQLGYSLPRATNRDDVPIQTTPRQIFNPFKKEMILGAAASAIHSVVFSHAGLYTFGKNEGQLGLVDSDARSLEAQTTPRRVGASLFNAAIHSVSAIDQATAILLHNHEVWVFAQYGYLKLSFPLDISSKFIRDSFMTTRYDTAVNRIIKIRSGGNTICALSSFGEVFTVQVNTKTDAPTATSTTNPSKIRNAVAPPARVWALKKAHMAVKDVDVGQDGSIIICTASGSAWRKEKRGKSKDGVAKEYKFARVPGLSRVVGVCSNSFGAFAAAQRDCDVTREQIEVGPSTLWKDLLPLSPFGIFASTDSGDAEAGDGVLGIEPTLAVKQAVMSASDIESFFPPPPIDLPQGVVLIMTTLSDVQIPVHEFVLSGRSSVLRKAFHSFRKSDTYTLPDVLSISHDQHDRPCVLFHGLDIYTVLNLAFFIYTDNIFDMWHLARHTPESALRYRQVRTEVMRFGTHLNIPSIERAARLMIDPHKSLKSDMARAITDPAFFESGDVVIDLNDDQVRVHSQVICQRCLFFDVLFNGRSGGRWLLSRRENSTSSDGSIRVDLRHIDKSVFDFVMRYMYADTDEQLFDEVRSKDLDSFMDLVFDVAFVANELMIDRLAQVCQRVLGQFVNARNACSLLNSIAPCYVTEFRDAALEYICLNLEGLLTNRSLEDLNENLLSALDQVCHDNQLSSFPVSRGRNTDEYIFETHPELAPLIEGDRQQRIDSMKLRTRLNNTEGKRATNGDKTPASAQRAKTKDVFATPSKSPSLRPKQSAGELMFAMDDEQFLSPGDNNPKGKGVVRGSRGDGRADSPALASSLADESPHGGRRNYLDELMAGSHDPSLPESPSNRAQRKNGSLTTPVPWTNPSSSSPSSVVTGAKKNLKDIMQEATSSQNQVSNLSLGMSMSAKRDNSQPGSAPKMSQKERKKMQILQMQQMLAAQERSKEARANPWGMPPPTFSSGAAASSKLVVPVSGSEPTPAESGKPTRKPSMTMRQTVAGTPPLKAQPRGPVAMKPGYGVAGVQIPPPQPSSSSSSSSSLPSQPPPSSTANPTPTPTQHQHQHRHQNQNHPHPDLTPYPPTSTPSNTKPKPKQSTKKPKSTSLSTILLQQQTEKDEIREAATAKHNLHDIQLEQQFQEWWNKESRRVQGLPEDDELELGLGIEHGRDGTPGKGRRDESGECFLWAWAESESIYPQDKRMAMAMALLLGRLVVTVFRRIPVPVPVRRQMQMQMQLQMHKKVPHNGENTTTTDINTNTNTNTNNKPRKRMLTTGGLFL
ncbi:hypothetical protein BDW42DRAFT_195995 [Aspergillus taichungensis]|uniref:BTB domain-containing protein n=1 Tax=Aspergillus taichungensis TaxID=482145 RepID=A0A2J5HM73_9EURO|nr:hypothetical protein BDW42DRAFT_195995 [Aspergillus taichungensis]